MPARVLKSTAERQTILQPKQNSEMQSVKMQQKAWVAFFVLRDGSSLNRAKIYSILLQAKYCHMAYLKQQIKHSLNVRLIMVICLMIHPTSQSGFVFYQVINITSSMEQTYKSLARIAALKREQVEHYRPEFQGQPQAALQRMLMLISSGANASDHLQVISKFINYMSEQRSCKITQDSLKNLEGAKVMPCADRKVYHFQPQQRAYCLYGKAVSAIKRKGRQSQGQRQGLVEEMENAVFQLHLQGQLVMSKNESHEIDDILLHFQNYEESCEPIYLANEVFSPFVPQPYALVLVLPAVLPRQDQLLTFLKGSLLHVYSDFSHVLSRVMNREIFYKNSVVRGIYFIQQGEVESMGGRVVARGWVSNGRCKSAGYGWRFKPLPFLKALAKNEHLWKQFFNDLVLNHEYPFRVGNMLGLQDQTVFERVEKKGGRRGFLPRIGHGSFDMGKMNEIQKVKHYDDRIGEICDYKEKLLQKKAGSSLHKPFVHLPGPQVRSGRRMLQNSKTHLSNSLSSSSQNILIMSVLKKLEGLTELSSPAAEQGRDRRDKIRISPVHLYQKTRVMKKKRYNQ